MNNKDVRDIKLMLAVIAAMVSWCGPFHTWFKILMISMALLTGITGWVLIYLEWRLKRLMEESDHDKEIKTMKRKSVDTLALSKWCSANGQACGYQLAAGVASYCVDCQSSAVKCLTNADCISNKQCVSGNCV